MNTPSLVRTVLTNVFVLWLCLPASPARAQLFQKLTAGLKAGKPANQSTAVGYQHDPGWPRLLGKARAAWGEMSGLCLDHSGNLWAFHRGTSPVEIYSPAGELVKTWGTGEFGRPHQVRVDQNGHVWLADAGLHVVRQYTVEGKLLRTLGTPGVAGVDASHFNQPTDMAIGPRGDVYVADGYGNNRVVQFNAQGEFVRAWGQLGSGPGEFNLPHSIAMDQRGRLYVADRSNARVQVFDGEGRFLDQWTGLIVPWHIVITGQDEVYICGSSPMRWPKVVLPGLPLGIPPKDQVVAVFDTTGRLRRQWFFPLGRKEGELDWLHALAVDPQGNLYLGDIKGHRAQKFLLQDGIGPQMMAKKPQVDTGLKPAGTIQKRP